MAKVKAHLSLVVNEILAEAAANSRKAAGELDALKYAEALPVTDLARDCRALSEMLKASSQDVTYEDLWEVL